MSHTGIRIVLFCAGCVCLFVGSCLYEDQEKRLQSKLERLWIKLDDRKDEAHESEKKLLVRVVRASNKILDGLFGTKLISLRAAVVSVAISCGAAALIFYLFILSMNVLNHIHVPLTDPENMPLLLVVLALTVICLSKSHTLLAAFFCFAPFVIYQIMTVDLNLSNWIGHGESVSISLFISILSDLLVIVLVRQLLKKFSFSLAFTIIGAMFLIGGITLYIVWERPDDFLGLILLNISDELFLFILFTGVLCLALHHLAWPSICHGMYGLQRAGILAHRKTFKVLGVAFITVAVTLNHLQFDAIWKALAKIAAG